MSSGGKNNYYAVANGRTKGIYMSWPDCEAQVKGYSGAQFKKFDTVTAANDFVASGSSGSSSGTQNTAQQPSSNKR